jgi:catechol 2,3-dioxygenase-like lactoylglutathione lyase family enzyme
MIIDHIELLVSDYTLSMSFYTKALSPLGIKLVEREGWFAFGKDVPVFYLREDNQITTQMHIAFLAESREMVRAFYNGAIEAGGKDNGAPGIRENCHSNYYAAFILDPDGHNIEAVCHKPE